MIPDQALALLRRIAKGDNAHMAHTRWVLFLDSKELIIATGWATPTASNKHKTWAVTTLGREALTVRPEPQDEWPTDWDKV